jgi:hypothetical protein
VSGPFVTDDHPELYSTRNVIFSRPFTLGTAPELYPAGTYAVETKEQVWEAHGHRALHRVGTVLIVPTTTGTLCREVSGADLDEAIALDAVRTGRKDTREA